MLRGPTRPRLQPNQTQGGQIWHWLERGSHPRLMFLDLGLAKQNDRTGLKILILIHHFNHKIILAIMKFCDSNVKSIFPALYF